MSGGSRALVAVDDQHSAPAITLKVLGQDGVGVFFRIGRKAKFQKLFKAYCKKRHLEYNTVTFLYDGDRLNAKQSPDDFNMEDVDEIDAVLPFGGGSRQGKE